MIKFTAEAQKLKDEKTKRKRNHHMSEKFKVVNIVAVMNCGFKIKHYSGLKQKKKYWVIHIPM